MKLYANDDDALIFWNVPAAIPGCLGFAIKRRTYDPADQELKTVLHKNILVNRIGFIDDPTGAPGKHKVSTRWPFQRFWWTDHTAGEGDILSYQVVPMMEPVEEPVAREDLASEWSPIRVLSAPPNSRFNPFFNRGFVISQFMARYLARKGLSPAEFKKQIKQDDEDFIRSFLYGYLGPALFKELRSAASENGEIYAALYELDDHQLIELLCALGPRAHVVLSNGSIKAKTHEPSAEARKRDQNDEGRRRLLDANVDVGELDRFTSPGGLAHNKFLVRTDDAGNPLAAWTGSTTWTTTGLCTQLNNGLLTRDTAIAEMYMAQWKRLRDAGSKWPAELVDANTEPKPFDAPPQEDHLTFAPSATPPPASTGTVWFSRTHAKADLKTLIAAIEDAKAGILFLMFMPGNQRRPANRSSCRHQPRLVRTRRRVRTAGDPH